MINLAVLAGELSAPPDFRVLASGARLAQLQLRVPGPAGKSTSVPVAMWDPPPSLERLSVGDAAVVVGAVTRRFFRTRAGSTGSRVEVVATRIEPAGDARRRAVALRQARRELESGVAP